MSATNRANPLATTLTKTMMTKVSLSDKSVVTCSSSKTDVRPLTMMTTTMMMTTVAQTTLACV